VTVKMARPACLGDTECDEGCQIGKEKMEVTMQNQRKDSERIEVILHPWSSRKNEENTKNLPSY